MSVEQMREYVTLRYPNDTWASKVSGMPERQIKAIYYSLLTRDNRNTKDASLEQQISIFDWLGIEEKTWIRTHS